ncbi:MAG: glycine zipper family protein [Pseudomonadota bacterium]
MRKSYRHTYPTHWSAPRRRARSRVAMGTLFMAMVVAGVGCTTTDEIIIDRKGVDMARYAADKAECETYADEVRTGEKAARGAASGAVIGGAVGGISGDSSEDAAQGAGVGAVLGTTRGLAEGQRTKVRVVKQCLRGRGYRILN